MAGIERWPSYFLFNLHAHGKGKYIYVLPYLGVNNLNSCESPRLHKTVRIQGMCFSLLPIAVTKKANLGREGFMYFSLKFTVH